MSTHVEWMDASSTVVERHAAGDTMPDGQTVDAGDVAVSFGANEVAVIEGSEADIVPLLRHALALFEADAEPIANRLVQAWRAQADSIEAVHRDAFEAENTVMDSDEHEAYGQMVALRDCADQMVKALSGDLDMASSTSRQHHADASALDRILREDRERLARTLDRYAMEPEQSPAFNPDSALFSVMHAYEHCAHLTRRPESSRIWRPGLPPAEKVVGPVDPAEVETASHRRPEDEPPPLPGRPDEAHRYGEAPSP